MRVAPRFVFCLLSRFLFLKGAGVVSAPVLFLCFVRVGPSASLLFVSLFCKFLTCLTLVFVGKINNISLNNNEKKRKSAFY